MTDTPLFLPLIRQYFEAFVSGLKTHEYRLYGPRWNEKTCFIGRRVTLSLGYGKKHRITGTVVSFEKCDARLLPAAVMASILTLFGTLTKPIAKIGIAVDREVA